MNHQESTNDTPIYRFKFTELFTKQLHVFAKLHEFDERSDFKEAWVKWLNDNDDIVSVEIERHQSLGFKGDVKAKMYESVRYYYRKKGTVEKGLSTKKKYIQLSSPFLEKIVKHIMMNIESFNDSYKSIDSEEINDDSKSRSTHYMISIKPSTLYENFCNDETNHELINREVDNLRNKQLDYVSIQDKIKKNI